MIALKNDYNYSNYLEVDEIKEFLEASNMSAGEFIKYLNNGSIQVALSSKEMMDMLEVDMGYSKELYEKLLILNITDGLSILKKYNTKKGSLSEVKSITIADVLVDTNEKCFRLSSGKIVYIDSQDM